MRVHSIWENKIRSGGGSNREKFNIPLRRDEEELRLIVTMSGVLRFKKYNAAMLVMPEGH